MKKADGALGRFDAHLSKTQGRGYKAGQQIGTGIKNGAKLAAVGVGLLATQVVAGINQLAQLEEATAQTEAALKSTRGVSGQTADSVRKLAEQYENLNAIIDDKVIQSGENVLLTFTNIRKEAFQPALAAALDLSVAMKQDLQQSIVQIGKALNDPAKGFTALRRVGIQFTADQEKQIKSLQKSGDLLGAQKIILGELGTEFGGRFAAQGRTATGTIAGIGDAVEDLQKAVATGLFPVVQKMLPKIRDGLASPAFARNVEILGQKIAGLFSDENIRAGTDALKDVFNVAKSVAPAIESAAKVTGQVVKTAVDLFRSLPPELQSLAIAGLAVNKLTGGLVTNIAGGLISAVISSFKGLMNVNAAVVNVNGAVGGLPGIAAPAVSGAAGAAGLGTAAALGIGGTALAVGLIGAVNSPAWVKSGALNDALQGAGLTQAERAAQQYYTASAADQAEMRKHLSFLPSKADFDSGNAKLVQSHNRANDAIDHLRGDVAGTLDVSVKNPGDIAKALSKEEIRATISADQRARGLTGKGKHSTSVNPRLQFLAGGASDSKDVAVASALALGFERNKSAAFHSTKDLKRSIDVLRADAKTLSPKNAAKVGGYIDRLKAELKRRTDAGAKKTADAAKRAGDAAALASRIAGQKTAAAIRDKDSTVRVTVPVSVKQFVNGRLLEASTGRFTSTIVGSRGTFAEFG